MTIIVINKLNIYLIKLKKEKKIYFRCGGRAHVVSFKAFARIPITEDISKRLYSLLHEPPATVPRLEAINETISVNEYRKIILNHYLKWRLEFTEDQESNLKKLTTKLRNKSFARLKNNFDVLHDDCQLSIDVVRKITINLLNNNSVYLLFFCVYFF